MIKTKRQKDKKKKPNQTGTQCMASLFCFTLLLSIQPTLECFRIPSVTILEKTDLGEEIV